MPETRGSSARMASKEEPMAKRSSLARRKAKADVRIARVKRKIKTLARQLKTQQGMLSKRMKARKKMK
jgi:hypothetical protein